ncbi:MAG: hypothetical protein ACK526_06045 [Planctomyces sp.]|jgi:hypothetical protein
MSKSRLSMRREVEAAEAAGVADAGKKTRKKATTTRKKADSADGKETVRKKRVAKPRTRKAKEAAQRRRLVWVVYSSTMREEGRFLFYERDKAEERLQQLLSKGKRRYFIQPIKEVLNPDGTPVIQVGEALPPEDDLENEVVRDVVGEVEVPDDIDLDADLDLESDLDGGEAAEEATEEETPEV